jgi:hypothetical protein
MPLGLFNRWRKNTAPDHAKESASLKQANGESELESLDKAQTEKVPTIKINGKNYSKNDLPGNVVQLIQDIRIADRLIRLKKDKLKALQQGRQFLGLELQRNLATIQELPQTLP